MGSSQTSEQTPKEARDKGRFEFDDKMRDAAGSLAARPRAAMHHGQEARGQQAGEGSMEGMAGPESQATDETRGYQAGEESMDRTTSAKPWGEHVGDGSGMEADEEEMGSMGSDTRRSPNPESMADRK